MGFRKELREPWGLLLAASSVGIAWAVQVPTLAAVGVGAVVLAARAAIAAVSRNGEPAARTVKVPDVDAQSAEGNWLKRARAAAAGFESISASLSDGPLAERVSEMEPGVHETVETLHRLAGRATTTGKALGRIDPPSLAVERAQLQRALQTADADVHADLEQAMAAIQAQEDVYARLLGARNKLLAQLQSGAFGLDSLVARVVELSATTEADMTIDTGTIGELSDQLEGIRRGVVETEAATRRSLGG
jgi:hypothetical protein